MAPKPRRSEAAVTALAELITRSQPRPTGRPAIPDEDELDPPERTSKPTKGN